MRPERCTSKPARPKSAASRCTRGESAPAGSPMIRPRPMRCTAMPGAALLTAACTTQPTTCATGIAAAMAPRGSTLSSGRPPRASMPAPNHHGTPFIAGSTTVSSASSGARVGASAASAGLLTAITSRSCGPSSRGSSAASATGACSSVAPSCSRQPWSRSATRVVPRARAATCALPSSARRVPRNPPMAPAPTTQIFKRYSSDGERGVPAALAHVQAAVQGEISAGREGGLIAGEPADDRRDLIGLSQAFHRDAAYDLLEPVGLDGAHHLGADVSGRDGVDGDTAPRDFLRQRHGEAVDAGLGRRIVGLPELSLLPVHRRNVDDSSPAALEHAVDDLLGDVEERVEIGLDDRVPGIVGHLLEGAVAGDTRIVHEDVDGTDLCACHFEGTLRRVPVGDVALGSVDIAAGSAHVCEPALLARRAWAAPGDDRDPIPAQAPADRRPDAAHSSGNVSDSL